MVNQTGLEKFKSLENKMVNAVSLLEKVKAENNGVLPKEYSEKAHQIKKELEAIKSLKNHHSKM